MTGLLLVDKPQGMTSHDVVDRIRMAARMRKIGHTGTLDPNATGLLILCLGRATRLSEHLTGLDKEYEGIMRLGQVTDSYDLDGALLEEKPVPELAADDIQAVCDGFTGEIAQEPPMVSAVKVGGERLYKKARKGEVVERKPRNVKVREFTVLEYACPDARIRVGCSSGTYVRSLCHDVGRELGCGAVLAGLRRTRVGRYSVSEALSVEGFTSPELVEERLLSIDDALELPAVVVDRACRGRVASGGTLTVSDMKAPCTVREGWVQVKDDAGELLALGTVEPTAMGARVHPRRVFIG